ncbi:uncharacterized protein PRCAT00000054001 [Priceomyces carsonii]|uniref:uncharacterized protein n=1 Tax=Priceomyces carsonii TaxID=28549 RepID=UPI002EDB21F4|nr:unnamed protein product [Priceomyces carsonii]
MSRHPKTKNVLPKKQRSILEFTRHREEKSVNTREETIDLTKDEEEDFVKSEYVDDEINTSEIQDIICPVCNIAISELTFEIRIRHVEQCLTQLLLSEKKVQIDIQSSKKRKGKYVAPLLKEKEKYVNKKLKVEESGSKSVIKPPSNLKLSTTRSGIPEVKILSFPISYKSWYKIAVDAFHYSHDKSIDQYFLTHFHSDHYGGISKKWCYERLFENVEDFEDQLKYKRLIYCTEITSKLLTMRFSIDPRFMKVLQFDTRYKVKSYDCLEVEDGGCQDEGETLGLYVTPITANHCPGAAIFLFQSIAADRTDFWALHCGDFRVNSSILKHPKLLRFSIENKESGSSLDEVYLDTTYMSPNYNFPKQELVCESISEMLYDLISHDGKTLCSSLFGAVTQSRITDLLPLRKKKKKLLILIGTYLIGKENLAISILKRLGCPIFALTIGSRSDKSSILRSYNNEYLNLNLVDDDLGNDTDCVIHLVPMKIVNGSKEILNYFNHNKYFLHFEKCIGIKPTGWTFHDKYASKSLDTVEREVDENKCDTSVKVHGLGEVVKIMKERPRFSCADDIVSQGEMRQSKKKKDGQACKIYSLPYSEHSSYRELSYFVVFFKIEKVIPTVNLENPEYRSNMYEIIKTWEEIRHLKLQNDVTHDKELDIVKNIKSLSLNTF